MFNKGRRDYVLTPSDSANLFLNAVSTREPEGVQTSEDLEATISLVFLHPSSITVCLSIVCLNDSEILFNQTQVLPSVTFETL